MSKFTLSDGKSWKFGDATVHVIIELNLDTPWHVFYPVDRFDQNAFDRYKPEFVYETKMFRSNDQIFLIKTPDKNILIDTGDDMSGHAMENLREAGIEPEDVDYIFFTHLHFDHIRRNCKISNGVLEPVFPNAKYMIGRKEFEYWTEIYEKNFEKLGVKDTSLKSGVDIVKTDSDSYGMESSDDDSMDLVTTMHLESYEIHIRPLMRKGVIELIDDDFKLGDLLEVVPTPGHTPGHYSYLLHSKGDSVLFSGDAIHQPIQLSEIDLSSIYDYDPKESTESRRKLYDRFADTDTFVFGNHFVSPHGFFIEKDEENGNCKYRF